MSPKTLFRKLFIQPELKVRCSPDHGHHSSNFDLLSDRLSIFPDLIFSISSSKFTYTWAISMISGIASLSRLQSRSKESWSSASKFTTSSVPDSDFTWKVTSGNCLSRSRTAESAPGWIRRALPVMTIGDSSGALDQKLLKGGEGETFCTVFSHALKVACLPMPRALVGAHPCVRPC